MISEPLLGCHHQVMNILVVNKREKKHINQIKPKMGSEEGSWITDLNDPEMIQAVLDPVAPYIVTRAQFFYFAPSLVVLASSSRLHALPSPHHIASSLFHNWLLLAASSWPATLSKRRVGPSDCSAWTLRYPVLMGHILYESFWNQSWWAGEEEIVTSLIPSGHSLGRGLPEPL